MGQLMAALVDVEDMYSKAGIPSAPGRFRQCKCTDELGTPRPCEPPQIGYLVSSLLSITGGPNVEGYPSDDILFAV